MKRVGQLAVLLCVLALVVTLFGCGGQSGPAGGSVGTAGKPPPPPPPASYTVVNLGTVGSPYDVNDVGQIVGYTGSDYLTYDTLLWEDNGSGPLTPTILPRPDGTDPSYLGGISNPSDKNLAVIAGTSFHGTVSTAIVWESGGSGWAPTELPLPAEGGYTESYASGVSDSGSAVVGYAETPDRVRHAVVWEKSGSDWQVAHILDTIDLKASGANDVNDSGLVIAGNAADSANPPPFVWDTQTGSVSNVQNARWLPDISNLGAMAGTIQPYHAALWSSPGSSPTDLGVLSGYEASQGFALDDQGPGQQRVVGNCWYQKRQKGGQVPPLEYHHAFIWKEGVGMKDLNTMVGPGSGWVLTAARGINRNGYIVGNGNLGAYMLRPISSP